MTELLYFHYQHFLILYCTTTFPTLPTIQFLYYHPFHTLRSISYSTNHFIHYQPFHTQSTFFTLPTTSNNTYQQCPALPTDFYTFNNFCTTNHVLKHLLFPFSFTTNHLLHQQPFPTVNNTLHYPPLPTLWTPTYPKKHVLHCHPLFKLLVASYVCTLLITSYSADISYITSHVLHYTVKHFLYH